MPEHPQLTTPTHVPDVLVTSHPAAGSIPEKLTNTVEKTAQQFCKQLGHMHRAKDRLKQSLDSVRCFPTRYLGGCRASAICVTRAELDATWQSATEGDYACLITFPREITRREAMAQMHRGFTTFTKN